MPAQETIAWRFPSDRREQYSEKMLDHRDGVPSYANLVWGHQITLPPGEKLFIALAALPPDATGEPIRLDSLRSAAVQNLSTPDSPTVFRLRIIGTDPAGESPYHTAEPDGTLLLFRRSSDWLATANRFLVIENIGTAEADCIVTLIGVEATPEAV